LAALKVKLERRNASGRLNTLSIRGSDVAEKRSPTAHRTPSQIRKHGKTYQASEEQIKNRSQRNAARREMEKKLGKKAVKGKDVDHKKMLSKGGSNSMSNLRVTSRHSNRGRTR